MKNFPALQTFVSQYLTDLTTKPYCWSQLVISSSTWCIISDQVSVYLLCETLYLLTLFDQSYLHCKTFLFLFYSAFMSHSGHTLIKFVCDLHPFSIFQVFLRYFSVTVFLLAFFHYKCTKENFPWWCLPSNSTSNSGLPTRPNDLWGSYHSGSSLSECIPRNNTTGSVPGLSRVIRCSPSTVLCRLSCHRLSLTVS